MAEFEKDSHAWDARIAELDEHISDLENEINRREDLQERLIAERQKLLDMP